MLGLRDYLLQKSDKPVQHPGAHGSHEWYFDNHGKVVYGERPSHNRPLATRVEYTDYHHGQRDGYIVAGDAATNEVHGHLDFSHYGGETHINHIEVKPQHRRKGVGRALYHLLQQEAEGRPIKWGLMTDEGKALKNAVQPGPYMPIKEGHRAGNWEAPRRASAGDVVRYEENELDNDLGIPPEIRGRLDAIPASALRWVTLNANDAARYGEPERIEFGPNAIIISEDDGDGGYLVLYDKTLLESPQELRRNAHFPWEEAPKKEKKSTLSAAPVPVKKVPQKKAPPVSIGPHPTTKEHGLISKLSRHHLDPDMQGSYLMQELVQGNGAGGRAWPLGHISQERIQRVQVALDALDIPTRALLRAGGVHVFVAGTGATKEMYPAIAKLAPRAFGCYAPPFQEAYVFSGAFKPGDANYLPFPEAQRDPLPYTVTHEMGHAVDHLLGLLRCYQDPHVFKTDDSEGAKPAYGAAIADLVKANRTNERMTLNMRKMPEEFFADAFALYHVAPDVLREMDHKTYAYMDIIMEEVRERVERARALAAAAHLT